MPGDPPELDSPTRIRTCSRRIGHDDVVASQAQCFWMWLLEAADDIRRRNISTLGFPLCNSYYGKIPSSKHVSSLIGSEAVLQESSPDAALNARNLSPTNHLSKASPIYAGQSPLIFGSGGTLHSSSSSPSCHALKCFTASSRAFTQSCLPPS